MKWNYESSVEHSTGYEDAMEQLKQYTKEKYCIADDKEKEKMIEEVFQIYRNKNIFPIIYYNEKGIKKEIQKCIDKDVEFKDGTLALKLNQGSSLCKFLFPNLHTIDAKVKNNSMYERFYNDHKLKRAIRLSLSIKKGVTPSEIRTSLELIGGNVATNFKPMVAKALYEKYCPEHGVIHDSCSGLGGRLLGALCSKNNYTYVATEVWNESVNHLNNLGGYIEEVTGRKNIFRIIKKGSEEFNIHKEIFDFSFSSPPYFNLEMYGEDKKQSTIKFPTLEDWLSGFVKPTIQNTYDMLKKDKYYAINIADFNMGNKRISFVDNWIKMCEEIGFKYIERIDMRLQTRKGIGHNINGVDKKKEEGIYIFKK